MKKILAFSFTIFFIYLVVACSLNPTSSLETNVSSTETFTPTSNISTNTTTNGSNSNELTTANEDYIESLLSQMTLSQKAAQMVQAEKNNISYEQMRNYGIGSVLSGGGSHPNGYDSSPQEWYQMYYNYQQAALASSSGIPLLYGVDAVHGHNNLYGATIFPHNIGLGMANDSDLIYRISQATAEEMLVTGIRWNFAPALSVVQNIRWGRTYEGYSENPEILENLTASAILGYQDSGVSATAKHFLGDGGTISGIDQGNMIATESVVRSIHLAPYYQAIAAEVDTIMVSFSSVNGTKMHGNPYWVNEVLKTELGFSGFVISDWNGIHQLEGDYLNQVVTAINSGVDMLMEPHDWLNAIEMIILGVNQQRISLTRIDDAVKRILTVKYNRGLFDNPYFNLSDSYIYNSEHQELAREAVRKSLVLLKNDNNSLPLVKSDSIYLTGPASDHVGYMSGGWTTYWQGNNQSRIGVGTSIKQAFDLVLSANSNALESQWQNADTVVVVLTELPYAEGNGDNNVLTLTGGNAHPDNLAAIQIAEAAHNAGKNVVGVLISGRPLLLENNLQYFDSFVAAWLPGSEGGLGISDVIFGDYDFVAKLSYTWPRDFSQISYTSNREDYDELLVLFPYGFGLTYNWI
jgi:beta-glucosidase